jgi:hypothetical protein
MSFKSSQLVEALNDFTKYWPYHIWYR